MLIILPFLSNLYAGVISGALLYIRDDFEQVEKSTVLQVLVFCSCYLLATPEPRINQCMQIKG